MASRNDFNIGLASDTMQSIVLCQCSKLDDMRGMPYQHLPGRVKIILSLPSQEVSYRYETIIDTVATRCHI